MALSDPLGDMLTRIRNGQKAGLSAVTSPASKLRANVLDVLQREGFIRGYESAEGAELRIELKYHEGHPVNRERRGAGDQSARPNALAGPLQPWFLPLLVEAV